MPPKSDLPWRRRQLSAPKKPWHSKLWASRTAWAGAAGAAVAAIAWILTNGVDSLSNLRKLPSEVQSTYHLFQSWYYDDALWTGTWSSRVEAYVDDLGQSNTPLKLVLVTEQGIVNGEMLNKAVCEISPLLLPVLIEGRIRGGAVDAHAFVYRAGQRQYLYRFKAIRDSNQPLVVTLTPTEDPSGLLPPAARLAISPHNEGINAMYLEKDAKEHHDLLCPESPSQYMQRLRMEGKLKSVEELWKQRDSSSQK